MNELPDIEISGHVVKERGTEYFKWFDKVKKVLFNDPTVDEINEIRREVDNQTIKYKNKVKELKAYIDNHSRNGDRTDNEKELMHIYSKLADDMEYLSAYIGQVRPSSLVEQTGFFTRIWNWITRNKNGNI